jgi:integrase
MPRINQEFLDTHALMPPSGQVIYRDEDLAGFAVRVTPNSKSFIVEKRVNGNNRRVTIGKCDKITVEFARKMASKILGDMANGIDPVTGRKGKSCDATLRQVFEKYLAVRKLRPMTRTVYKQQINHGLADWLDLPVTTITKDMIQMRHKKISSGTVYGTTGNATANHTMQTLRALLNFASDHFGTEDEPLFKVNPVSRLSRDRSWHVIPIRQGIIPDKKLSAWYNAVVTLENTNARDYFLLLLMTGFRRTEAATLTWNHVNFEEKMLFIPGEITKNHNDHHQPMSDFVFELLRERNNIRRNSNFVFPGRTRGRISEFRPALAEIRERSGCTFTIHDMRRTFLTMAEKLEVPSGVIKKLANHCDRNDATQNYIVHDRDRLRLYVNKIANEFVQLMDADMDELLLWHRLNSSENRQQLRLPISIKIANLKF